MSGMTGFVASSPRTLTLRGTLAQVGSALARAVQVATSRRHLVEMDDHMLSDLGISRAQANFEASRKPWELTALSRR